VNSNLKNKNLPTPITILKKIGSHINVQRKKELRTVFILSIFASLAESISIAALIPFISFFVNPDLNQFNQFLKIIFNFFNINDNKEILAAVSFLFIFAVLTSSLIKLKYIKLSNTTSHNITCDFRVKIFNFLINQDFNYYFKHGSSEILSNLIQKTSFFNLIIFASINILNSILISTAIVIVLIMNEPLYTPILVVSIMAFYFIVFKIKSNTILKAGQKLGENENILVEVFENSVGYLPEIILYNLKNFYSKIFTKASRITATSHAKIKTIGQSPRIFLELFTIVFVILLIFFSGFSERPAEVNIAYLAILAFGAQKCLPLINNIYFLSVAFQGAIPNVSAFLNILEGGKQVTYIEENYEKLPFEKTIKLEKICFQYTVDLPKIFNNFNLEIIKGDKVAIKGWTGSGKSTLVNIISGLLDPTEGKILIDGKEITSVNKKNWQKNISIVPQMIFLNDTTLSENIALAVDPKEINIDKVKLCAELACISDFIEKLPNKYNQQVGERGIRLSGGQKQRIGIARALYRDSNIIILDEPTNALDLNTEKIVMDSIIKLKKNITLIMISHSNNTLKYFDKIIDLDKLN